MNVYVVYKVLTNRIRALIIAAGYIPRPSGGQLVLVSDTEEVVQVYGICIRTLHLPVISVIGDDLFSV